MTSKPTGAQQETGPSRVPWLKRLPASAWIAGYRPAWLAGDVIAGFTLAAYLLPVAMAYAGLAGLPPQAGLYGAMLGGLGYALLGSSRQLAIGPTSAISLMLAGTLTDMAAGDPQRAFQIASLVGVAVAFLCALAWLFRLSMLVRLISDSILVGFKAGAGLSIIMTQLPSLLGVEGGGTNFFERAIRLAGQLPQTNPLVLTIGLVAIVVLLIGQRLLPGRPVGLTVVAAAIGAVYLFGLEPLGVRVTGAIPAGLPALGLPELRLRDVEGIFPVAAATLLLAYIEGISAGRNFAAQHGYTIDPRQEFLGLGAANLAAALGHGYPVAAGLSQSAVNDGAGARTPLALVFASLALALGLVFLTGPLAHLPKAVLAAIVLTAVYGLIDPAALARMWRISRMDFWSAIVALAAVLLLGILQGIVLAVVASVLMLLARASSPHVAFLGRVPGTQFYSDLARHPENEGLHHVIAFRPEGSLLYISAETVLNVVLDRLRGAPGIRAVVCDLSACPAIDLAGSRMLHDLAAESESRGVALWIVGAHGRQRDLLRADGLADKVSGLDRFASTDKAIQSLDEDREQAAR